MDKNDIEYYLPKPPKPKRKEYVHYMPFVQTQYRYPDTGTDVLYHWRYAGTSNSTSTAA